MTDHTNPPGAEADHICHTCSCVANERDQYERERDDARKERNTFADVTDRLRSELADRDERIEYHKNRAEGLRSELADMTAQRDAERSYRERAQRQLALDGMQYGRVEQERDQALKRVTENRRRAEAAEAEREGERDDLHETTSRYWELHKIAYERATQRHGMWELCRKLAREYRDSKQETADAVAERDELQARIDRAVALATAYAGHGEYAVNSAAVARDIRELLQPVPPADDSSETGCPRECSEGHTFEPPCAMADSPPFREGRSTDAV